MRKKYEVYSQHYFITDYPEAWGGDPSGYNTDEWRFEGETWAVSEKQAINNVRFRNRGEKSSQYAPDYYSNSVIEGYYWKAVAV